MDFDGVNTYRSQAGPDPARADDGGKPEQEVAWIALMLGYYPARRFADTEVYHLAGTVSWRDPANTNQLLIPG